MYSALGGTRVGRTPISEFRVGTLMYPVLAAVCRRAHGFSRHQALVPVLKSPDRGASRLPVCSAYATASFRVETPHVTDPPAKAPAADCVPLRFRYYFLHPSRLYGR